MLIQEILGIADWNRASGRRIDWNRDGKIDGWDHGFTAFLIDEANGKTASGCCGTTAAMFLIGIILPVVLAVVFMAHA